MHENRLLAPQTSACFTRPFCTLLSHLQLLPLLLRAGRVNAMLQRRIELLEQVATLARQLGVSDDAGYTCETAGYFYLLHVLGRWERFCAAAFVLLAAGGEPQRHEDTKGR